MLSNVTTMSKTQFRVLMVLLCLLSFSMTAFAQVTLEIPTDDIFQSINDWIVTFAPIIAIGIGIAAAIAILSFVGNEIIKAFRGRK